LIVQSLQCEVTARVLWMEPLLPKAARSGVHARKASGERGEAEPGSAPCSLGFGHPPVPWPQPLRQHRGCCQAAAQETGTGWQGTYPASPVCWWVSQPGFVPFVRRCCPSLGMYKRW